MGTVMQTADEIDRLMDEPGAAVHLLLDTGHATWGGADPAALAPQIPRAHRPCALQGCAPRRARGSRRRRTGPSSIACIAGVYTVPGDGMVDYVSVFKELPGYSGWVVVEAEQDPKKAEPAKYAKMGYDNLDPLPKAGRASR